MSDTRVYEPHIRARLGTTTHFEGRDSLDLATAFPLELRGSEAEDVERGVEGQHVHSDLRRGPCFETRVYPGFRVLL